MDYSSRLKFEIAIAGLVRDASLQLFLSGFHFIGLVGFCWCFGAFVTTSFSSTWLIDKRLKACGLEYHPLSRRWILCQSCCMESRWFRLRFYYSASSMLYLIHEISSTVITILNSQAFLSWRTHPSFLWPLQLGIHQTLRPQPRFRRRKRQFKFKRPISLYPRYLGLHSPLPSQ